MTKWEEAWQEGRIGWDAGDSPPILHQLVAQKTLPAGRALVPGCGAGYDVLTLASPNRKVIGLDAAPSAKARFQGLLHDSSVDPNHVDYLSDDFFNFEPSQPFDLVWDYTFLCAIQPERRPAWSRKMSRLIRSGGELVTLLFPVIEDHSTFLEMVATGPPFPLVPEQTPHLVQEGFEPITISPVPPSLSHEGRRGKEWLARFRRLLH